MNPETEFDIFVKSNIEAIGKDSAFTGLSNIWIRESIRKNYAQNFTWLGRPIIQVPQDIYAIQELIWRVKPDLVIETGIAHGGSLIMSASMLALLDYCEAVRQGESLQPGRSKRKVLGVDIEIRPHNRRAINEHPLSGLIEMIEGSSIDSQVIEQVQSKAENFQRIMIFLDSNHTHEHVLGELQAYAPLTSSGSYCVVWDTGVEDLPDGFVTNRPWGKGNNPKTAVFEYLRRLDQEKRLDGKGNPIVFSIDKNIEYKLGITAAPDGFLVRA